VDRRPTASQISRPTRSQTAERAAPVASATIVATRGRMSSMEKVPAIRSDNTSYGVARFPYT
jgi:hypothetical protein